MTWSAAALAAYSTLPSSRPLARPVLEQWRGTESKQVCFSAACKNKIHAIGRCMRDDPSMVAVPSVTLDAALAAVGTRTSAAWRQLTGQRGADVRVDLLKVDCEGAPPPARATRARHSRDAACAC